jgi:ATP-dependent helicase/nuclease subunit B
LVAGTQRLVETLVSWMPQYRFDPRMVEVTFGLDDHGLPPWRIELARGRALALRGRIDRVDLCRTDAAGEALAVVIDYKSSPRSLDAVKLQCGLELQLLSYLGALRHLTEAGGALDLPALLPAGVFYVSLKPQRGFGKTRAEARAKSGQAMRSGFQHSGRFNADWLGHFDSRGESKGDQFKYAIKRDGSLARRGNDALEATAFQRLLSQAEDHLRRIGDAIYDGEASVAPFRKGSQTACDFCAFRAICRFDSWVQPYRVLCTPWNQAPEAASRTEKPWAS